MFGREVVVILGVTVTGLTGCSGPSVSSGKACAQPETTVSGSPVAPGQELTLSAKDMWDGCNDQGTHPPLPPLRGQPVEWTQTGTPTVLGTTDADDAGQVSITVRVPATAKSGPATVRVGSSGPATVMVTEP
jgi:hypothetical protein